ncbi:Cdc37 N terminal kinase binding-domain-containing protein [Achaetomium macrosporum]|uniref:Hsp90 chaperone protein kinase-targeting subunit n=1 Tax=Achaetomium macrosporum TaxID=79813 RepID=A0AAN7H8S7_9PEZI|nr:Cdc37 N terminal kinase binding-domain-containing protein [Achaetomium macrosporum]
MVDYRKWDALELSDDSDIEVHPNVDKRSFIRAKQNQIHMERQQRKREVHALKHERIINDALLQRLHVLASTLRSQQAGSVDSNLNPADIAFQAVLELASTNPTEDSPPSRPEGVFDSDLPPLPTYSKMLATILDEVNKTLQERQTEKDRRYEAFIQELGAHVQKVQDLQAELVRRLDTLEQQDSNKITSESYHVGFDSSHVNKTKPGGASKQETTVELLNPNHDLGVAKLEKTFGTEESGDGEQKVRPSLAATRFAQIPVSDYRASHGYLQSHPEIIQNESDINGLLIEAYYAMLDRNNEKRAWQYVHQALLLEYCHTLGRDGVALFFKCMTTPGHRAREDFQKDLAKRFQKIRSMARRDSKQKVVEQVQLYPVSEDSSIRIRVPPAGSQDEKEKRGREIFEQFSPEMRAALESASLEEINKVLAEMAVPEAEKMVSLLDEAGCLHIEEGIIDATTEEGKRHLDEAEETTIE